MAPCYSPSTKQHFQFCIRSATSASATGVILQAGCTELRACQLIHCFGCKHWVHASSFTACMPAHSLHAALGPFAVWRQGASAAASLWLVAVHLTRSRLLADATEQSCHLQNSALCPNEIYFDGCGLVHAQKMSQCNLQVACQWGGQVRVRFSNNQYPVPEEFLCSRSSSCE